MLGGLTINTILDIEGNVVYEESSLGPDSEIPYFLIACKENSETTKLCFERMDSEVNFVNNNSIHTIINEKPVEIKCKNFRITQMDCKCLKEICGLNGAFCRHCFVIQAMEFQGLIANK